MLRPIFEHFMNWKVTTEPTNEPVARTEAKLHLKVDYTTDDDLIDELIKTARQWCEDYEGRSYMTQTITLYMDSFCSDVIYLPRPPILSVDSVKYLDDTDTWQTLDTSIYDVDLFSNVGRIILAYGQSWPTTLADRNAVQIIYKTGYSETAADASKIPSRVKSAMKLIVGHLYENRENSIIGLTAQNIPMGATSLLNDRVFYAGR
jgi:uncharacterized phiE125 gp8 family phage protein